MCRVGWAGWLQVPQRHGKSEPLRSRPQIVRTFRIETRKASKAVARRKVRPCSCLGGSPRAGSEEIRNPFFLVPLVLGTYCVGARLRSGVCVLLGH